MGVIPPLGIRPLPTEAGPSGISQGLTREDSGQEAVPIVRPTPSFPSHNVSTAHFSSFHVSPLPSFRGRHPSRVVSSANPVSEMKELMLSLFQGFEEKVALQMTSFSSRLQSLESRSFLGFGTPSQLSASRARHLREVIQGSSSSSEASAPSPSPYCHSSKCFDSLYFPYCHPSECFGSVPGYFRPQSYRSPSSSFPLVSRCCGFLSGSYCTVIFG